MVSVLSKGSLSTQCSVVEAEALANIDESKLQTCMGTSVEVSKYKSCLSSSGVSLSSGCVNCLADANNTQDWSTVTSAAQVCGATCAVDPQEALCQDCVAQVGTNALQCFALDMMDFTTSNPSGQSGVTTKSALVSHFAAATGIFAITLLS